MEEASRGIQIDQAGGRPEERTRSELEQLVGDATDGLEVLREKIGELVTEFNEKYVTPLAEKMTEAYGFVEDIVNERQTDFDDKSERWQEGERGQAAQSWLQDWESGMQGLEAPGIARSAGPLLRHSRCVERIDGTAVRGGPVRTRADRDEERQKWAEEMGLLLRHNCKTDNTFIERFLVYEWPKDAGRKYDRDVIVTVYEDGSWGCALDDGTIKLAESKDTMQRMALAAEQKGE
jgi:hypothetical protein